MKVIFSKEAEVDLSALLQFLSNQTYPDRAEDFVDAIIDYCYDLGDFPYRGQSRDDLLPGLRILGFRRSAVITIVVEETIVRIMGVYYGGIDLDTKLDELKNPE